jgi:hypothetical protein
VRASRNRDHVLRKKVAAGRFGLRVHAGFGGRWGYLPREKPAGGVTSVSHPLRKTNSTVERSSTARISAVCAWTLSFAFTFALRFSNNAAAASLPAGARQIIAGKRTSKFVACKAIDVAGTRAVPCGGTTQRRSRGESRVRATGLLLRPSTR